MVDEGTITEDEVVQYLDGAVAEGYGEYGSDYSILVFAPRCRVTSEPEAQQRERQRDGHKVVAHHELHDGVEGGDPAHEAVQPKKYGLIHVRQCLRRNSMLPASARA